MREFDQVRQGPAVRPALQGTSPRNGCQAHAGIAGVASRQTLPDGTETAVQSRPARRGLLSTAAALAVLWGALTGWDATSWVMGAPAVAAGTALTLLFPPRPRWRLSLPGALRFVSWFAVQAVRGALDVSRRTLAWHMPLAPGFRSHPLRLPPGPARLVFVNAITLLPGTLSAEISEDRVVVHMLDTRGDLAADLDALETRVRALFAIPDKENDT